MKIIKVIAALSILAAATVCSPMASELGINCKGSIQCKFRDCGKDAMTRIQSALEIAVGNGLGNETYPQGSKLDPSSR